MQRRRLRPSRRPHCRRHHLCRHCRHCRQSMRCHPPRLRQRLWQRQFPHRPLSKRQPPSCRRHFPRQRCCCPQRLQPTIGGPAAAAIATCCITTSGGNKNPFKGRGDRFIGGGNRRGDRIVNSDAHI